MMQYPYNLIHIKASGQKAKFIELSSEDNSGCSYKVQAENEGIYITNRKFMKHRKDTKVKQLSD